MRSEIAIHKERFHFRYRMPFENFDAIVELLGDAIVPDVLQAKRRNVEPIYPEMTATIGIGGRVSVLKLLESFPHHQAPSHHHLPRSVPHKFNNVKHCPPPQRSK